jgi:DNA invertase Pin-like site-specific DNA recombinase
MARRTRRRWPGYEPGHTFKDLTGKRAIIYCRVSSNPDETEQKSVGEQEAAGRAWADQAGVSVVAVYHDDDYSASKYASKQRPGFRQVQEAIEAERCDITWFWSTSRQTRGDIPLDVIARSCEDHGVLWCFTGQVLNPANEDDMLVAGIHHIVDRRKSADISKDVIRGKGGSAAAGRPACAPAYGYRRVYDTSVMIKGRPKIIGDEPNVFDGNGRPIEDSPAYIVREIYDRLARGDSLAGIRRNLEDRGIPTPRRKHKDTDHPFRWGVSTVRFIATNPAYVGKRVYQAESHRVKDRHAAVLDGVETMWPPLVTEEQWWAVQRILGNPDRLRWRPGTNNHLLTSVAKCAVCGDALSSSGGPSLKAGGRSPYYHCMRRGCVSIRADWLDAYVEDRMVSWLADPEVFAALWQRREDDSAVAAAARTEIERLGKLLEDAEAEGKNPSLEHAEAVFWARRVTELTAKLREAEQLARPPSLSPVLAALVGPDAADGWWKLRTENLGAARQVVAMVADVRVRRGSKGGHWKQRAFQDGRVKWRWLIGPEAQEAG